MQIKNQMTLQKSKALANKAYKGIPFGGYKIKAKKQKLDISEAQKKL